MTHEEDSALGQASDVATSVPVVDEGTSETEGRMSQHESMFAPLSHRAFRWLWIAFSFSTMGIWMESLGAQWYLVSRAYSADLVPLVQAAITLPVAVLALPAGVLADNFDRRRILIVVQACGLVVTVTLTVMAWRGLMSPVVMLVLTGLVGVSSAMSITPFQSLIPDLVDRSAIPAASGLNSVGVSLARIIGPVVAGLIVALVGVPAVFLVSSATCALFLVVLLRWSGQVSRVSQRERFFPAVRTGVRYVRHSPQALRLILRASWFAWGMASVFALLPLLATRVLHLGPGGFGSLFACIGVGAVAGGFSTATLRRRLHANAVVGLCFTVNGISAALLPFVTAFVPSIALLMVLGWGWTACLSTTSASMQLYLPAWVRSRGLAVYWVALFGGQAAGAALMGAAAAQWGLKATFIASGLLLVGGATTAVWLPLKRLDHVDRTPSTHWPEPQLVVDPTEIHGEVVVQTTYWVDAGAQDEFLERMCAVRRVRLRTGGAGWRLLKDAEQSRRYVEEYSVSSWLEHEYQLHNRLVASDRELEQLAADLSDPGPRMERLYRFDAKA